MTKNRILPALKSRTAIKKKNKRNTASRNISRNTGKAPEKPAAGPRSDNFALSLIRRLLTLINHITCFIKHTVVKKRIVFISAAAALIIIGVVITFALAANKTPAYAVAGGTDIAAADLAFAGNLPATLTPVPTTEPDPSAAAKPERTDTPDKKPTAKLAAKPTRKPASANLNELIKFYQVKADKYYSDYGYSSNHYEYTDSELRMLAQVITREAGGESYEGQLAVGNVIMNRVLSRRWGKTIESVITAPNQFSYKPETSPKASCLIAAADVLKNEHWVVPQSAYFFRVDRTPGDNWGRYKYCVKIGAHCFYTHKIGSRSAKSGIPPALYERVYKWPQYGCKTAKRVSRIQYMLSSLGYKVDQDGRFGKSTKDAISDFQKHKKIKADGVAGPSTLKALIKAYGIKKYCSKYGS